jgi:hypothetical protein
MNLFLGFLYGFLAQVLTFIQLQGPLKWNLLEKHRFWLIFMGLPISWLFMNSVKNFVIAFDGTIWPSRLIGFSIGIMVFTVMAQFMFSEGLSLKTGVCIFLGILILAIQLFWK